MIVLCLFGIFCWTSLLSVKSHPILHSCQQCAKDPPSPCPHIYLLFCSTVDVPIRVRQYHTCLCFISAFPNAWLCGASFQMPTRVVAIAQSWAPGGRRSFVYIMSPLLRYPTHYKYLLNGEGHDSATSHRYVSGLLPNTRRSVLLYPFYKWWLWGSDRWSNLLLVMWPGQEDLELELGLWCSLWISGVFVFESFNIL